MLALNFPGQMSWDSVAQLTDGRSGFTNSWHPPLMAVLLGTFDWLLPGTGLFLVFQTLLILLALLALTWRQGRAGWWTILIALLIVLTPQWLLFQGEIWKDTLFADAAIAGFAALACAEQRWRADTVALAAALFVLAASVRQPGLVLLPVSAAVVGLVARRHGRCTWRWGIGFLAATLLLTAGLTIALTLRGDGGEGAGAQLRLAQAYDLSGALARDPGLALPLGRDDPALDRQLRGAGATLYSPLRNDPLMADRALSDALAASPPGAVAQSWRTLVLRHPLLYARVRAAAFRAVLVTPDIRFCHFAPAGVDGDPTMLAALGLAPHIRPQDAFLSHYASLFFATPVYSHPFWIALGLVLLIRLVRRGAIALSGLLAGALLFALTFVIVSIACDYRYLLFADLAVMAAALTPVRDRR